MRIHSKNFVLFSAVLFLGFTSCKKRTSDNNDHANRISFSADGQVDTFYIGAGATKSSTAGRFGIDIQAYKFDVTSHDNTGLFISISRPTAITTGTYVENAGGNPLVSLSLVFDTHLTSTTAAPYGSLTNPVTITITNINATAVEGTFSGELLSPGLNTGGPVTPFKTVLTNGAFDVDFH